ncbi:MAG: L-lactate dehydrogenase [Calditrichaeota bacterium]|nr:L-lactate dehydrogenase [Calditrichota bacterium]RQW03915.1 MAG: L-lactate dehydrogenase [Calditrichota bacterium]
MKIGIVGSGLVGSTAAYALVMRGIGRRIVLIDKNKKRAEAEADDIRHAVPFAHPVEVQAGDFADLKGSKVVIISAGVSQKPGETRLHLLGRNAAVFRDIIPHILQHAPDAVLLNATNPVDIMTHMAAHYAGVFGIPSSRIIGSGTTLDTARFRTLLGKHLEVDSQHVHAYVVGEHGDSEVLAWSLVNIGGIPLEDFIRREGIRLDKQIRDKIDEDVRKAAYHIIEGKGSTYYGIGSALARIVSAVIYDQRAILTVCSPVKEVVGIKDVTFSLPHLVGGEGIIADLPFPVYGDELKALQESARIIKNYIVEVTEEVEAA